MTDSEDQSSLGSVIWITGLPNSGKTTVSRLVWTKLKDEGFAAVRLDGDDLRSILAHRWGYSESDRQQLAATYSRLVRHLSSQGLTVVVSVVAMFDSVYALNRDTIQNYVEVYLDVPYEERLLRDKNSAKHVYASSGYSEAIYDVPNKADLRIANYGAMTPDMVADEIVAFVLKQAGR